MKKTIAQNRIEEMNAIGYKLVGQTSGTLSFRRGSNLSKKLESLGLTEDKVYIRTGARAGKNKNDGYQLLIFTR